MEIFTIILIIIALGLGVGGVFYGRSMTGRGDWFIKALRAMGIKLKRKDRIDAMNQDDEKKHTILNILSVGGNVLLDYGVGEANNDKSSWGDIFDQDQLTHVYDSAKKIAGANIEDYEKFLYCFRMIRNVDVTFPMDNMISIYHATKDIEAFTRAWCDQINAGLDIDFVTALKFVSDGRDFASFVNLDLMAKRAEMEIDEKHFINDIDDEGLKVIIYSLIRAKYEGIYLSEVDSYRVNKANVLEYNDTFKITLSLLVDLYKLGRDVNRFTNVMIRAHNSGIRINFSIADLYSLSDSEFDNLVTNIIRASDCGINIDQKDLIRQNIQGNDITSLISALIKAFQCNLELTPDDLMNYFVNTRGDVVKFVNAVDFSKKNNLGISKDYLVELSKPGIDLFDFVQGIKIARDCQKRPDNYGITEDAVKLHFKKFGRVKESILTVIKAQEEMGLKMNFGIAGKILEGGEYTLKSAIAWAQNPQVIELEPRVTCVCKNGVQVTPKVSVTVRGKMEQIFWGYKLDILFKRINEALVSELESADDHNDILRTLPQISVNVLQRINEEENNKEIKTTEISETELNNHCSYNLLDINVYDLIIGSNVKAELELRQAQIASEMRKLKAEADRAKAEADIRIAMVQQFKDGIKPNFNELHKANLLAESNDDINTGYENPE